MKNVHPQRNYPSTPSECLPFAVLQLSPILRFGAMETASWSHMKEQPDTPSLSQSDIAPLLTLDDEKSHSISHSRDSRTCEKLDINRSQPIPNCHSIVRVRSLAYQLYNITIMATPQKTENLAKFEAANATFAANFKAGDKPMPPARKVGASIDASLATSWAHSLSSDQVPETLTR